MKATPGITVWEVLDKMASMSLEVGHVQANLACRGGQMMLMWTGGPQEKGPSGSEKQHYSVALEQEPPRFWERYEGIDKLSYLMVPRLVIANYVIGAGGVHDWDVYPAPEVKRVVQFTVAADATALANMKTGLETLFGVTLLAQRELASD